MAVLVSGVFSLQGTAWVAGYFVGLLAALIGALLIFKLKLPLYRAGRFLTFGAKNLPEYSRGLYRSGLFLSCAGCLFCLLLLIGALTWR